MKIKEIFNDNDDVTLNNYLTKCGVLDVDEFLNPSGKYLDDWIKYNNILDACQEIKYQLLIDGNILIVQDGDVDGICSTYLIYKYLTMVKPNLNISILLHTSKQRGLDDDDIMNEIRNRKPTLVIVPDAGTNNYLQAEELCNMRIGLLVLDHHDFSVPTKNNPNAKPIESGTLINNQDPKSNVNKNGSGTLVVHKFLQALDKYLKVDFSSYFIDMVALSLVSDSMNMSSMENRTYYHFGLETKECINNVFIRKMFDTFIGDKEYTQRDISFKIIPKLNAICRCDNMEYKQRVLLALLQLDNLDEVLEICNQAHINQTNKVSEIIENNRTEIETKSNDNLIVFYSDDIPKSYSGLVCGKIMNLCGGKPSIVGSIKDDYFMGSLRSPIPLRTELEKNDLIDFAQGHEQSCGIGIEKNNIKLLIDYFNSISLDYSPCENVLKSYPIKTIPKRLFSEFKGYESLWGKDIVKPEFCIKDIYFYPSDINILGANKRTLKLILNGIDILIFNVTKEDKVKFGLGYIDDENNFVEQRSKNKLNMICVGSLGVNEWRNKKTNQIIVNKYELIEQKEKSVFDVF